MRKKRYDKTCQKIRDDMHESSLIIICVVYVPSVKALKLSVISHLVTQIRIEHGASSIGVESETVTL